MNDTLYTIASGVLREAKLNIVNAVPKFHKLLSAELLTQLEIAYLTKVAADLRFADSSSHRPGETHPTAAGASGPQGHSPDGAQGRPAKGPAPTKLKEPHSRGKEGPHRRSKMPTEEQRRAEIDVDKKTTIFDTWRVRGNRNIGDLFVYELRALALQNAKHGFEFVARGKEDMTDGFAFQLIDNHIKADHAAEARVRDVINEKTLKEIRVKASAIAKYGIERVNNIPSELLTELLTKGKIEEIEKTQSPVWT